MQKHLLTLDFKLGQFVATSNWPCMGPSRVGTRECINQLAPRHGRATQCDLRFNFTMYYHVQIKGRFHGCLIDTEVDHDIKLLNKSTPGSTLGNTSAMFALCLIDDNLTDTLLYWKSSINQSIAFISDTTVHITEKNGQNREIKKNRKDIRTHNIKNIIST